MKESDLQSLCVKWFKLNFPRKIIAHIPNGGKRNYFEALKFKRLGVLPGIPDIAIFEPSKGFHGLFIELKIGKNKITPNQENIIKDLLLRNYSVEVCNNFDDFKKIIKLYFNGD